MTAESILRSPPDTFFVFTQFCPWVLEAVSLGICFSTTTYNQVSLFIYTLSELRHRGMTSTVEELKQYQRHWNQSPGVSGLTIQCGKIATNYKISTK